MRGGRPQEQDEDQEGEGAESQVEAEGRGVREGGGGDQRAAGIRGETRGIHEADDPAMRAGGDFGEDDRDHRSDQPYLEHPDQPERCHRPGGAEQELQSRRADGDPEKGSMPPLKDRKPAQIVRPQHRRDPVGKDDEPRRPHCFRLSDP